MEAIWKIYRLPTFPGLVGFLLIVLVAFLFCFVSVRIIEISIFHADTHFTEVAATSLCFYNIS